MPDHPNLGVVCPRCGAGVGAPCVDAAAGYVFPAGVFHLARDEERRRRLVSGPVR